MHSIHFTQERCTRVDVTRKSGVLVKEFEAEVFDAAKRGLCKKERPRAVIAL
jgi:hypothetical protein